MRCCQTLLHPPALLPLLRPSLRVQLELLNRSCLQAQKRGLLEEVSCLKLKLRDMENKESNGAERQHKAENTVEVLAGKEWHRAFLRQHAILPLSRVIAIHFIKTQPQAAPDGNTLELGMVPN
ncbi:hypothetical protein DNTS_020278 [Danionella cerebrum]|uniref:Liprin-beta-1/2 coiled-coil domain-containing protein n=1 Tax=Danionella cerebrum TaxID=2873325 RepID=A0A553Q0F2_9TELE|nr:hypothetical protein DNTS_020278 [Danionella translucida]